MNYNLSKICRICLEEGVLSPVFSGHFTMTLSDMILDCTGLKLKPGDGLPENICSNCMYKLGVAHHLRQTCLGSNTRLRQYLGLPIESRFRDACVSTDPILMQAQPTVSYTASKYKAKRDADPPRNSRYKRKPEAEKLKRGPKPKPTREYRCYECDKDFRCQAQLDIHIRTHTGEKPFSCVYCPRQFTQKHNLAIHMRVHTGERPYQCEVCSKRFTAQGNLQAHLKIHTGERDQVCTICKKGFITSSELTRHMAKHRGVKNYKCDMCQTAFVQPRDLKLHKKKKHNIDIPAKPVVKVTHIQPCLLVDIPSEKKQSENTSRANPYKPTLLNLPHKNITEESILHKPHLEDAILHKPHLEEPRLNLQKSFNPLQVQLQPSLKIDKDYKCPQCGEDFHYLSLLSQHCALRHPRSFAQTLH